MADPTAAAPRRGPVLWSTAAVVLTATVITGAILADGYDEQEVPRLATDVWVTRDDGRYARVNTELGELEQVKTVAEPAGVVQSGSASVVFTHGFAQGWPVDPAFPLELVGGDAEAASPASALAGPTPSGTEQVVAAGDLIAYRTSLGEVHLGTYPAQGSAMPMGSLLDPYAEAEVAEGDEPPRYVADAVAVDPAGTVVIYSDAEQAVREYDANRAVWVGEAVPVSPAPADDAELSLTIANGRWAMLDSANGSMWAAGLETELMLELGADPVLQATASEDDAVLVADADGLLRVDLLGGGSDRVAEASGTPAAPVVVDGAAYAAWVDTASATLWDAQAGELVALDVEADVLADVQALAPVFRTNGDRAVLTEVATGSIWTVPDGRLLPASAWDSVEDTDEVIGEQAVEDIVEQEPPVAVDDAFGVRAGAVVSLPVLYNDHDPNSKDVLTIDPASVSALADPDLGEISLVSQDQEAVIRVRALSGTTTFTYAVTDGHAISDPATVTLTVVPDHENSAPVWCGVEACTQEWPRPQVAPGGYTELSVLRGWVDPEGDPIVLFDARADDPAAPVTVVPTDDGRVAIRHLDPNAGDAVIPITVTVTDSYGEHATRTLELQVTSAPTLDVRPVAVTGVVAEPRQVDIADHVTGGSGSYRLVDAVLSQSTEDVALSPIPASGIVELTARAPGRFNATYTVEDTVTGAQSSATLRYSVSEDPRPISVPPLTTFVRAQEDATVDVLASTQNTTGRVLMIAEATSADPQLSVSVVGASYVRVSGTTETGEPGLVGTADVVVADGAGNTASTQLTVFLLPPADGLGPIAMPDNISVRAGSQVDIPVLDNDTAPRGDRLVLAPEVEGSGAEGELAFASRKVLRYLAPQTPGVYTLRYSTFIESNAERMDSSTVTVTVLPTGSNRAPVARVLTARVHVGQTVRIPFDPTGVDPDGDPVTLVEVGQPAPAMGTASVSATGTAISYRAPIVPVPGGQATFTYTVVDDQGATATGTVRVGVLDGSVTDVAPITYSDYVSAQVGSRFHIPVAPLLNDSDPLQGELRILDVRPHALPGSAEHRRLEGLFDRAAFEADGTVRLLAGDISGTHAYVYTVESPVSLSTAEGRIVVDVSDAASPSMLSVQDTVLTARTRHDLVTGIDVVTGKVQWQGGDISGLTLALWGGSPNGLTVDGWSISGALPAERTVVPFSLSGRDNAGNAVTTYGFLRIPALDDMRLQLAPDITPVDVGEEETAQFDVLELLDIGPSDAVDLRGDDSYAVQRANARCVPAGGVRASYAAGRESPWSDTCSVVVRLQGQDTWSVVAVPIAIMPKDPQAILNPLSRTIRPAEQDSVALVDELVTWEGGRVGDESALGLSASYSGSAFDVTTAGGVLRATARADAVPGTRETVRVSSAGFGGLDTTITLVVGAAAPDSPRGASFTHTCDVSAGSSCAITVVGAAGEYDPFAGATGGGLRLASVGTSGTVQCAVATVTRASDTQVRATWPGGPRPEGGECIVNFTVTDAQGRSGAGTVTIDVRGYPRPPATVTTVGYTGTSVTLNVALGPAAQAHPNVNTVSIHRGGAPVAADCRAAGSNSFRCTVSGLTNGQPGTYTARAVNAVGESLDSSAHTTWAYEAPVITSVTAEPAYRPRTTTTSQGIAVVTVVANADTRAFMIAGTDQTFRRQGPTTTFEIALPVGAQTLQLVPVSEFQPPTGTDNRGQSARANVTVAGSPSYASGISADANGTSISITGGELNTNSSAKPATQVWFAWAGGARPECSMDGSGRAVLSGSGYLSSTTRTISGLESNTSYSVAACGSNGYGSATTEATTAYTWVAPTAPDGSSTYRVSTSWQRDGDRTYRISLQNGPSLEQRRRVTLYYWYDGSDKRTDFRITEERVQQITAAYCSTVLTELCGERIAITPTSDSPPTTATVTFPSPPGVTYDDGTSQRGCFPAGGLHADSVAISAGARGSATVTTEPDAFVVTWSGPFINAATIRHAVTVCDPPPTPEPDPTTTPTP